MKTFAAITLILLGLAFIFVGCIGVDREFISMRNEIMTSVGEDFKTDVQFSIGRFGLSIASFVVKSSQDEEYIADMIDNISNVKIGVYTRDPEFIKGNIDYSFIDRIDKEMNNKGYSYIVKSREDDEVTLIYYNENPDQFLNDMFVVTLNHEELVMVDISGDLGKVVEVAIQERGLKIQM